MLHCSYEFHITIVTNTYSIIVLLLHYKHGPHKRNIDVLNSYRATANGARRLVTNIFLDKTKIDPSRIHERRFVNTRPLAKSVNRHSIQVRGYACMTFIV